MSKKKQIQSATKNEIQNNGPLLNIVPTYIPITPPILNYPWSHPPSISGNPMIQHQQQRKLKICLLCKGEPKFTCARCEGYYCSTECQRSDWQSHRFTCFAMPSLVPIKSKNRTVPPISMLPKNQSNVKVTGFRRTNLCYVRSVEKSVDENFKKGCHDIMSFGKTAEPMVELPQSNTYALAYCNHFYYRVQVLKIYSEDKIRVLFIDLGNVKTVALENLRNISSCIINILQHAVAINLKGVENYVMNEDQMEKYLKQFCDTEFKLDYNNDDDIDEKEFTLKSLNSDNTLNELITSLCIQIKMDIYKDVKVAKVKENPIDLKQPTKKTAENNNNKYPLLESIQKTPFVIEGFPSGKENFAVTILNNSDIKNGFFGCVERSNQIFLDKAKNYLKSFSDTREAHEPRVNEYCLANVENKWYRVQVLSIFENIYTVMNVDTTQEYKVTSKQLRRYPQNFNIPCKTVKCKLDGLQPNTGNQYIDEYLQLNFGLRKIQRITKVVKIKNNVTYVKMDELITDLMNQIRSLKTELSN